MPGGVTPSHQLGDAAHRGRRRRGRAAGRARGLRAGMTRSGPHQRWHLCRPTTGRRGALRRTDTAMCTRPARRQDGHGPRAGRKGIKNAVLGGIHSVNTASTSTRRCRRDEAARDLSRATLVAPLWVSGAPSRIPGRAATPYARREVTADHQASFQLAVRAGKSPWAPTPGWGRTARTPRTPAHGRRRHDAMQAIVATTKSAAGCRIAHLTGTLEWASGPTAGRRWRPARRYPPPSDAGKLALIGVTGCAFKKDSGARAIK